MRLLKSFGKRQSNDYKTNIWQRKESAKNERTKMATDNGNTST